ncbi:MAG: Zn-dependent hydrolase [Comamonadaceae bacterium]|nr:MAG: Zn-dependent hydrolase [Comamonadaceae bacterium]
MKTRAIPIFLLSFMLLLQGCSITSHTLDTQAAPGKASSSADMERMLAQPGPVDLDTVVSADWTVRLAGLLNLKNPQAIQAGLQDRDEPIQVYAYLLKHPTRGNFLVDTGVSRKVIAKPEDYGLNWLIQRVMHLDQLQVRTSAAEILAPLNGKLSGVIFTHLHIDHIMGLPDIGSGVPLYIGAAEASESSFKNMFVRGATDQMFKGKNAFQKWHFQPDPQGQFDGIVDVFEDGSVFAIHVPGHTVGSTAFLIRTTRGPVLLTGDACISRWGWDNSVEPGDFTSDHETNLKSLKAMKALVARHPEIEVRLGHQH